MMEDEDVVLIKSDVHKTVTFGPYNDDEKMIEIELTKRSKETKKLLNDAVYEIYDEDHDVVATLTTGTDGDGKASCYLPYGKYTIKETVAPAGYNMDDAEEKAFELSAESTSVKITYDNAGNGTYKFEQTDSPVPGQISLSKKEKSYLIMTRKHRALSMKMTRSQGQSMVCMPMRISRKMMAALFGRKILSLIRRQRQKTMRSILQEQEMMELRPEIFILENIM